MTIPLIQFTVSELIRDIANKYPNQTAIESSGTTVTYEKLELDTGALAAGLLSVGVKKGDKVAIWADMTPETITAFYAVQRIGAIAVMLHTVTPLANVAPLLDRAEVSALFVGDDYQRKNVSLIGRTKTLRLVISLGETDSNVKESIARLIKTGNRKQGETNQKETLTQAESKVKPKDPAVMLMTSGTTGVPKLVLTSHYSRINSGIQQAYDMRANQHDKFCTVLPMFHCFSLSANLYAALSVGACIYIPQSRHTNSIIAALRDGKCTILHAVPTQFKALVESPQLKPHDADSLRIGIIGGGGYAPKLFKKIETVLNFTLLSSLGMTEGTAGVTVCSPEDDLETRSTTVGHVMSHLEGKIIDINTQEDLPVGSTGEICIRGYAVMMGYYGDPDQTSKVIDSDGWLHSGDFGHLDDKGNLHLEGRIKELIIRGGENISPIEVETAILDVEGVFACKAEGVPDDYFGEEICAIVVREHGSQVTAEKIKSELELKIEKFKIPKYITFIDALPLNDMGKIDMKALKKIAMQYVL